MKFIDTHTHLFAEEFNADRDAVIQRALHARVSKMLLPNIDSNSIQSLKSCTESSNNACLAMMGLHPGSVKPETYRNELDIVKKELFSDYPYRAVGEIGLDLYWDKSSIEEQKIALLAQCEWAVELDLAVSLHTRSAIYETLACLKGMKKIPKGVFHCFTGSPEEAAEILKLGFKLGIGGVLTYKNSNLPDTLKHISPEHLVLETDSPYLPPVPYRGKRNESSYIPIIAEKLSEVYGCSIQTIADTTTANAESVFGL